VRALEPAFMLAMVGSLSSLLLSLLADSLTRTRHQPSRELIG
jgi:SulP family sulfate permease